MLPSYRISPGEITLGVVLTGSLLCYSGRMEAKIKY